MRESQRFVFVVAILIVMVLSTWGIRHDTFWGEKGNWYFLTLSFVRATASTLDKRRLWRGDKT